MSEEQNNPPTKLFRVVCLSAKHTIEGRPDFSILKFEFHAAEGGSFFFNKIFEHGVSPDIVIRRLRLLADDLEYFFKPKGTT